MKAQSLIAGCLTAISSAGAYHGESAGHIHPTRDSPGSINSHVVDSVTHGVKAGLSGYQGIQNKKAFSQLASHISWYSDYQPNTSDAGGVAGVGMLWGDSTSCGSIGQDRLAAFKTAVASGSPKIMFGFYEPDCQCTSSSQMAVADGISSWNSLLAPLGAKGTILGSPSACKQKDETWLKQMTAKPLQRPWDVTSVHINKNSLDGVKADVDYYLRTYQKPIWVSEFACVDDANGFQPCSDQTQIDQFVKDAVNFFHCNESVVAYGPSNGEGLGNVWPLIASDGSLSHTGNTYLSTLQGLTTPANQCT